jgi:MFS superfamily sulfate permease-like transporter
MFSQGTKQFIPFMITILGIVFSDLLTGIGLGMATSILIILVHHLQSGFELKISQVDGKEHFQMILSRHVSFLNKSSILSTFDKIPVQASLEIDARNTVFIHQDILDTILTFQRSANSKQITVSTIDLDKVTDKPILSTRLFIPKFGTPKTPA